ncbi:hypothetical protein DL93DRAFT_2223792 [Clavulina sp. PMI_390]|nr:hypothetical protein DL93DRAFT_2223792 [Clavulina sp. PMI_390]
MSSSLPLMLHTLVVLLLRLMGKQVRSHRVGFSIENLLRRLNQLFQPQNLRYPFLPPVPVPAPIVTKITAATITAHPEPPAPVPSNVVHHSEPRVMTPEPTPPITQSTFASFPPMTPVVPERRERLHPLLMSSFVPKSRKEREREAEAAAAIPLPPSPPHKVLELPETAPLTTEVETAQPTRHERPPSQQSSEPYSGPPSTASGREQAATTAADRKKSVAALAHAMHPSFRPHRAAEGGASSSQPRKVSAFGAPAIVTTVKPVAPPPPALAASAKGGKHSEHAQGSSNAASARSTSSRAAPSKASSTLRSATPTGAPPAPSASTSTAPAPAKLATAPKPRVAPPQAKPAPSKSTVTRPEEPKAAREPRQRAPGGMTLSQLAKQKPPVQRAGFQPTSKLRSARSNANLKGAAAPIPRNPTAAVKKVSKDAAVVAAEVAAEVPLPPSPKLGAKDIPPTAEAPLPSSASLGPTTASPSKAGTDQAYPTLESLRDCLSDVPSAAAEAGADSDVSPVVVASAPAPSAQLEESEFTLDELDHPREAEEALDEMLDAALAAATPTDEAFDEGLVMQDVPVTAPLALSLKSARTDKGKGVDAASERVVLGDVVTNI